MGNFSFLDDEWADLASIGKQAEVYMNNDPIAAIIKLRTLGEELAKHITYLEDIEEQEACTQYYRLRLLHENEILPTNIFQLFSSVRRAGNRAIHENIGTVGDAIAQLKLAYTLSVWFFKNYDTEAFIAPLFTVPKIRDPGQAILDLEELNQIYAEQIGILQLQVEELKTDLNVINYNPDRITPQNITQYIEDEGFEYVDNRPRGGNLWILEQDGIQTIVNTLQDMGFWFRRKETPRNILRAAWWWQP